MLRTLLALQVSLSEFNPQTSLNELVLEEKLSVNVGYNSVIL